MQSTKWAGSSPVNCQLCKKPFGVKGRRDGDYFIDGRTKFGPWALMCKPCHVVHGCGLGTGRGQEYERQADGSWVKING